MSIRKKYGKRIQLVICCLLLLLTVSGAQLTKETKAAGDKVVEMTFGETYSGTASSDGGTKFTFHLPSSGQIQLPITHRAMCICRL